MGNYCVRLLEKGIGNRVVAMQKEEVMDFDIYEALKDVYKRQEYDCRAVARLFRREKDAQRRKDRC